MTRETILAEDLNIADTFLTSLVGLMGKRQLVSGSGLWIVPCQSVHTFWMRFPIDVIFMDKANRVVHFVENLKPFRVSKHVPKARSVIELPVSSIRTSATRVGDQINISEAPN